jgi:hypothetical protein
MTVEKCNSCKKIINKDKHRFICVEEMKWGTGSYRGDLHFCCPECLIKFMDGTEDGK